jgi:nucleoid-associated protein YgaU
MATDTISPANQAAINDATGGAKSNDSTVQKEAMAKLYDDVVVAQRQNGNYVAQDLPLLNQQLHADGLLPSISIVGVENDQLIVSPTTSPDARQTMSKEAFQGQQLSSMVFDKDGRLVLESRQDSKALFEYDANGQPATVRILDGEGKEQQSGKLLKLSPDGSFEWYPSDWNGNPESSQASLMENINGVYASRGDDGQIVNVQRADGSFVENITRDTDGTTVLGLTISKEGENVTRLQVNDNVSSLEVADNGDIKAGTADGIDTYKLDGSIEHADASGHVISVDYAIAGGTETEATGSTDPKSDDAAEAPPLAAPATPDVTQFETMPLGDNGRQTRLYQDGSMKYDVADGDTLSHIAGDVLAARGIEYSDDELINVEQELLAANQQITDPDLIYIGDTLTIPALNPA